MSGLVTCKMRPMQCLHSVSGSVYHHPNCMLGKLSANSLKNYLFGSVWQLQDSISNNILMAFLMVISHPTIVYPLQINWIKSSCTIEWE